MRPVFVTFTQKVEAQRVGLLVERARSNKVLQRSAASKLTWLLQRYVPRPLTTALDPRSKMEREMEVCRGSTFMPEVTL
jgi:hypothetical protein